MNQQLSKRKIHHLEICATKDVGFHDKTTYFEHLELLHRALPELTLTQICTDVTFWNKSLRMPLFIGAMSGGTGRGSSFNCDLASVAERVGAGFCLGSMRPALDNDALVTEFCVRDVAPNTLVVANIGAGQIGAYGAETIATMTKRLGADGIAVHLNAGMELIQPEGDRSFVGHIEQIGRLLDATGGELEVLVKETGMGLSRTDARRLKAVGVRFVETGGAGGTSWVGVEALRTDDDQQRRLGELLWDFGVPTAVSTRWMCEAALSTISSGGVSDAMDIAKALALGADAVAMARPVLLWYQQGGTDLVASELSFLQKGLVAIMLSCGVKTVAELQKATMRMDGAFASYVAADTDAEHSIPGREVSNPRREG